MLPFDVIRRHSLSFVVPPVVIRCHSLLLVVSLIATYCHSFSLVGTWCFTRLSFYKRSINFRFFLYEERKSTTSRKNIKITKPFFYQRKCIISISENKSTFEIPFILGTIVQNIEYRLCKNDQYRILSREKSRKSQSVGERCRCGKWRVMHTNNEYLNCSEVEVLGYFQLSDMIGWYNVVTERFRTTVLQLYLIWTLAQILEHVIEFPRRI